MKQSNVVIVGTAVLGLTVFAAGIALGWYGFPALIVSEIKQVSTPRGARNNQVITEYV
jgi:hypothetical protein